jgi:hypothetical protein
MEAYVNFLAAQLFAEVSAMNAENDQRRVLGESMAYTERDYISVLEEYKAKLKEYRDQCRRFHYNLN